MCGRTASAGDWGVDAACQWSSTMKSCGISNPANKSLYASGWCFLKFFFSIKALSTSSIFIGLQQGFLLALKNTVYIKWFFEKPPHTFSLYIYLSLSITQHIDFWKITPFNNNDFFYHTILPVLRSKELGIHIYSWS